MFDEKDKLITDELLNEVLTAEPGYALPDNFAEMIVEKADRRFVWAQYVREFLIYLAVIVGIAVVCAAMAFIWYDANWKNWLSFLSSNVTLVAGINFLLVFILFADRVLLRYFMHRAQIIEGHAHQ